MYKDSELIKTIYKPNEIAKMLGVTTRTLQNWDKSGKIKFNRNSQSDRRYLTRQQLIQVLDKQGLYFNDADHSKKDIIYARVSSNEQKSKGDLDRQIQFLISNIPDLHNLIILDEVGSGLNDNRPKLMQLLHMVLNNEVNRIFITYKDRLTRFGFNYIQTMCNAHNVKIIIVKQNTQLLSVEQELVQDMMDLIASFSGKLYGMRSKKSKLKR